MFVSIIVPLFQARVDGRGRRRRRVMNAATEERQATKAREVDSRARVGTVWVRCKVSISSSSRDPRRHQHDL